MTTAEEQQREATAQEEGAGAEAGDREHVRALTSLVDLGAFADELVEAAVRLRIVEFTLEALPAGGHGGREHASADADADGDAAGDPQLTAGASRASRRRGRLRGRLTVELRCRLGLAELDRVEAAA